MRAQPEELIIKERIQKSITNNRPRLPSARMVNWEFDGDYRV